MKNLYLIAFIVFFAACSGTDDELSETITYKLESDSKNVDIRYFDHTTGDFEDVKNVSGNWEKTFTYAVDSNGRGVGYLMAQNKDYNNTIGARTITVKILVDKKLVEEESCKGNCIASADYD